MMKLKDKITQGMLEDYEGGIWGVDPRKLGLAKFRGVVARAAVEAAWFDEAPDLDNPKEVARAADAAQELYNDLLSLDPHYNGGGETRPETEGNPAAA